MNKATSQISIDVFHVETPQIAPTILKVLGLNPNDLKAVSEEGTQLLPGLDY